MSKTIHLIELVSLINKNLPHSEMITVANYSSYIKELIGERLTGRLDYKLRQIGKKNIRDYSLPIDLVVISLMRFEKANAELMALDLGLTEGIDAYLVGQYVHEFILFEKVNQDFKEKLTDIFKVGYFDEYELYLFTGVNYGKVKDYLTRLRLTDMSAGVSKKRLIRSNALSYMATVRNRKRWNKTVMAAIILLHILAGI